MTEQPHYSNAPITEATITLRVARPLGLSVDDLARIQELVMDSYPKWEDEYSYSRQVDIDEAGDPIQTEPSHLHSGFQFISKNKQYVFYARLDSFALSVRAPYDRWEPFRNEARRLWNLYRSVTGVEDVTQAEVRYINQLDIASHSTDAGTVRLEEYLRVYPELPEDWPGAHTMSNFFMQVQLWQDDLKCWLVLNEAPVWPDVDGPALFQLDFDFFRQQPEEPWRADDSEIWHFLEQLRVRKNEVFEASITKTMRGLIR